MVVGMILLWLNFLLNLSLVGIKCLQFIIMTFPFSFRTSYNRGRLFCFMTILLLSQRFFLSVRILMLFPFGIFGNEWFVLWGLRVSVTIEFYGSKGLTEVKFVRSSVVNLKTTKQGIRLTDHILSFSKFV